MRAKRSISNSSEIEPDVPNFENGETSPLENADGASLKFDRVIEVIISHSDEDDDKSVSAIREEP